VDRTTGAVRGAFLETDRVPRRWQYGGTFSYFADLGGRNHELKTGYLGWRNIADTENLGYPNQQLYRYRSLASDANCNADGFYEGCFARPDSVLVYDYPNTTGSGEIYHSLYLNDKITLTRQFTLNVGVRWDRYSSYLPEQGNEGIGPFAERNVFPYQGPEHYPTYNTLVPRISAVYDVTGEGRIALKGSYGRYVGGSSGSSANPGPGANNVNPNAIITRTYSNWDGSIPYVPVEDDLTGTSGGGTNRAIDLSLRGPGVDEYTAGVDFGITRLVTASFNYVHKRDFGNNITLDVAEPFEAYTDVRFGTDPGPDNVVGTADDAQIPVWSVPRSWPTFGEVNDLIVQDDGPAQRSKYHAYGIVLNKQNANGWSGLISMNVDYRDVRLDSPRTPNEERYNVEVPEWNYSFRISGTYSRLPWGLMYGMSFTRQSGDWFDREVQVRNALNQTVNLIVQENFDRLESVAIWDNRITKRFSLPHGQSIEGTFELFNTLNTNTVTDIVGNNRNGSNFLVPDEIIAPRIFRLGVKYRF
jgi:hypothetical protein